MFKRKIKFRALILASIIIIFSISAQNIFASSVIVGATNPWPADKSMNVPPKDFTLIWVDNLSQYSPGCAPASSYDVYLSNTSDPKRGTTTFGTEELKENFINIGSLEYNEVYYWRVDTHDACGNVSQSPVWYFVTGGPEIPSQPKAVGRSSRRLTKPDC